MSSRGYRARHVAPTARRGGRLALTAVGAVPAVTAPVMSALNHHSQDRAAVSAPAATTTPTTAAATPAATAATSKARASSSSSSAEATPDRAQAQASVAERQSATASRARASQASTPSRSATPTRTQASRTPAAARRQSSTGSRVQSSAVTGDPRSIAAAMVAKRGWGGEQMQCLAQLWTRESSWQVDADNPTSDAYGIPQALPGERMASAGADWRTNPVTQIIWGLDYIAGRYTNPCGAWGHELQMGWY